MGLFFRFIWSNLFPTINFKFSYEITTIIIKNSILSNHTSIATNNTTKGYGVMLRTFSVTKCYKLLPAAGELPTSKYILLSRLHLQMTMNSAS